MGFTPKTNAFLVAREPPTRAERTAGRLRGGRIGSRLRSLGSGGQLPLPRAG
jgi:hypothetical protein